MPPKAVIKKQLKQNVILNTSLPDQLFKRLEKYKKDKGFDTEQQIIRVVLTKFLTSQGY